MLDSLFKDFDNIIVLDTETTGLSFRNDEIIELAFLRLSGDTMEEYDEFIRLSPGRRIPPQIVSLTGISDDMLENYGVEKERACRSLVEALSGRRTLLAAYNAQFDLCFLYYFLLRFGKAEVLQGLKLLDAMTVYKDRRPFPHKLANAVSAYALQTQNTHRAIDDTRATLELLCAMEAEEADLERYINLFGYNQKYGVSGPRISSVRYLPQGYAGSGKLYLHS
ncbi:MAG: 3'-5' exonuclease [Clostridia bacterium]|nr:MAG: 3'-5' exonuclease [Clostridia bacterium]